MANFNWLDQWRDVGRKVGHSPFSLDKKQAFGLPNSQIVPIHFIDTVPGDHFQIDLGGLMRTKTLNTAAFFGGKMFINCFFVPYSQLWHPFNQFISQKEDSHSSIFRDSKYAPVVSLLKVANFIEMCVQYGLNDTFGFPLADSIVKLFQFAKIKNFYPFLLMCKEYYGQSEPEYSDTDLTNWKNNNCKVTIDGDIIPIKVNIFRLLAYQHIVYDFYRNKYYSDYPDRQYDDADGDFVRWIDIFNVDDLNCSSSSDNELDIPCAGADRSGMLYNKADARIANMFSLFYHQYRKDVYTSLMPSTQFGAVAGIGFDNASFDVHNTISSNSFRSGSDLGRWYDDESQDLSDNTGIVSSSNNNLKFANTDISLKHDHYISGDSIASSLSVSSDVSMADAYMSVLDWRRAELLQQWKQNSLRAGNMVDDNFEAHYGVKPYYEDDNNVRFLGGFESRLDINSVVATAATASSVNGNVGDIAGIGIGEFSGRQIDFQCKDFGVIVCCASFVSDTYYNADGTDKSVIKVEPFDFFNKEFENVGFDSVELARQNSNLASFSHLNIGFTPPFTEYKTEVDEVYGSFMDTLSIYNMGLGSPSFVEFRGDMRDWVATRQDFAQSSHQTGVVPQFGVYRTRFYQSPALTNNIFEQNYDGTIMTDPFSFNLAWRIKAIRPMTVLGIPVFA